MKKILSLLLVTALLCGCSEQKPEQSTTTTATSETTTATTPEEPKEEGKEFNILCMDTSPMLRDLKDAYPGYEIIEEGGRKVAEKIGDINVNWIYYPPNADGSPALFYEQFLRDDRNVGNLVHKFGYDIGEIDLVFLNSGSDYYDTLIETYALPLSEIDITEEDTADMYDYTLEAGTYNGELLSLMRDIQPTVFIYRRSIAEKVLGTSDPEKVKEYVSDWNKFTETAALMKEGGYSMIRTPYEILKGADLTSEAPINVEGKATENDKVRSIKELIDDYTEKGYISGDSRWSEEWFLSFGKDDIFGAIEASWFADYSIADMCGETAGDWAVCEGPESDFYYGYSVFVNKKTDNPTLAAEMVRTLYCDSEFMMNYADSEKFGGVVPNNKTVIENLIASEEKNNAVLGGQNPYAVYAAVAEKISAKNTTSNDLDLIFNFITERSE